MPTESNLPHVLLLSIPGLRQQDLAQMPTLHALATAGQCLPLAPGFPAVTCPVQATLTTGSVPAAHGIVANGIFDRREQQLEMWISPDSVHWARRLWDTLKASDPAVQTACWFPLQSKHATADLVCMPAPKHNADGTETMWCHTRPEPLYESLREHLGDFPLHKFWGPLAGIESTQWIISSFLQAAENQLPHFSYLYLPHLDYAAQRTGPDSDQALAACRALDAEIARLVAGVTASASGNSPLVCVAGEYQIRPVSHALFPNRVLREAGLLAIKETDDGITIDMQASQAWALADHQVGHIYLQDSSTQLAEQVKSLFTGQPGVGRVLVGEDLVAAGLAAAVPLQTESRCGDVVIESSLDSWQCYFYWHEDETPPAFARTVDIHRKPGYDPLELHIDMTTRSIPLDPSLVRGSHGAVDPRNRHETVFIASRPVTEKATLEMQEIAGLITHVFSSCGSC